MSVVSSPDAVAIRVAGQCDRGKVREENQDTVRHTGTSLGDLLVVADGIGGFPGGGVASLMAADTISSSVEGMPAFFPPEIAVEEAVCRANAAIAAAASEPDSPHRGMGTTAVVALLRTESDRAHAPVQAIVGHVGDSRAYLVHNRKLTQLTRDHSVVQELIDSERITAEEAKDHPDASVLTRCLGREPNVSVDMREVSLEIGDTLLLCSDGLWGYVAEREIERVLADPALDVEAASKALLELALEAGGYDNVGVQLARIGVPEVGSARKPSIAAARTADPAFVPAPVLKAGPQRVPSPSQAPALRIRPEPSATPVSLPAAVPAVKPAAQHHEPLRIFEPPPRPEPMSVSIPIFTAASIAAPKVEPDPIGGPGAQHSPAPAFQSAPTPLAAHVPVIELQSTTPTDTARSADSMMLPELIVVPKTTSVSTSQSSIVSMPSSASPRIGLAQLAGIFVLAFAASSTLAYFAVVNNWFNIVHLMR